MLLSQRLASRQSERGGPSRWLVMDRDWVNAWKIPSSKLAAGMTLLTTFIIPLKRQQTRFRMRVSFEKKFSLACVTTDIAGVSELSDTDNFTRRQSLYTPINRRLRNLLTAARPYLERFEEFRASVVDNEEEIIRELTQVCLKINNCRDSSLIAWLFLISVTALWRHLSTTKLETTLNVQINVWQRRKLNNCSIKKFQI